MSTTLTLDEDVAARLLAEARRSGRSFKEMVNELLRTALDARGETRPREPFCVRARSLGKVPGLDYDKIGDLLDQIEGPLHR